MTLRCVPLFTIHRVDEPRPLDEVLAALDELADANDHFELFTFPYSGLALTRSTERTDREPKPVDARAEWLRDTVLENRVLELAFRTGKAAPRAIPAINRGLMRLIGKSERLDHGAPSVRDAPRGPVH